MNIKEYNLLQKDENTNQIAIDFDGVIHGNSKGFYDGTVYDSPIPGSIEAIKLLSKKYTIILFTAKAKPDRPLVNGKNGVELIWEWLRKYNLDLYIKEVTYEKPRAVAYIDDRAIRFEDWDSCLSKLKDITHVLPVDHSSLIYASKLRDKLSSVGNSNSSVVTSMDKYLSRKIFNDVSNIKIKHNYVNSLKDIETFLSIHNEGVLKPTNGTASNKVIKLKSNSIQTESIYEIIDECYDNKFIIEEFVDGMGMHLKECLLIQSYTDLQFLTNR